MPLLRTLSLLMTTLLSGCSALAPVNWLVPNHGYEKLGSLRYGDLPHTPEEEALIAKYGAPTGTPASPSSPLASRRPYSG